MAKAEFIVSLLGGMGSEWWSCSCAPGGGPWILGQLIVSPILLGSNGWSGIHCLFVGWMGSEWWSCSYAPGGGPWILGQLIVSLSLLADRQKMAVFTTVIAGSLNTVQSGIYIGVSRLSIRFNYGLTQPFWNRFEPLIFNIIFNF